MEVEKPLLLSSTAETLLRHNSNTFTLHQWPISKFSPIICLEARGVYPHATTWPTEILLCYTSSANAIFYQSQLIVISQEDLTAIAIGLSSMFDMFQSSEGRLFLLQGWQNSRPTHVFTAFPGLSGSVQPLVEIDQG